MILFGWCLLQTSSSAATDNLCAMLLLLAAIWAVASKFFFKKKKTVFIFPSVFASLQVRQIASLPFWYIPICRVQHCDHSLTNNHRRDSTQHINLLLNFWLLKWNKMESPYSLSLFTLPALLTVFPWIYFPVCDWAALYWHPHPDGEKNNPISRLRVHLPNGLLVWGPWRLVCNRHPNGLPQSPQLASPDAEEQRWTSRLPAAVPTPHPSPVTHLASVTSVVLTRFWFVSMSPGVSVLTLAALLWPCWKKYREIWFFHFLFFQKWVTADVLVLCSVLPRRRITFTSQAKPFSAVN